MYECQVIAVLLLFVFTESRIFGFKNGDDLRIRSPLVGYKSLPKKLFEKEGYKSSSSLLIIVGEYKIKRETE